MSLQLLVNISLLAQRHCELLVQQMIGNDWCHNTSISPRRYVTRKMVLSIVTVRSTIPSQILAHTLDLGKSSKNGYFTARLTVKGKGVKKQVFLGPKTLF